MTVWQFLMSYSSKGSQQVVVQVAERFETDRYGVDSIEMTVEIPDELFPEQVLVDFAPHPRFSSMALVRKTGQRGKPGWWTVNYVFEGFLLQLPQPMYELAGSLSQEPIQTHANFATIAGTPAVPANNAIFVDPDDRKRSKKSNAIFKEFGYTATANTKAGVSSYMEPGAEWRETTFETSEPSTLSDLGKINSPSGPAPSLGGRNWLAWSHSYQRRGHIYQVTTTWKLSGRNGWDSDIYGP